MILTALATVVFDLILAVEIGIAVAAVLALRAVAKSSTLEEEQDDVVDQARDGITDDEESALLHEHIAVYRIDGALFFGAAQQFLDEFTSIADVRVVILRLGGVRVVDASGGHALDEIISGLRGRGVTVLLCGIGPRLRQVLGALGILGILEDEHHVFSSLPDAVAHAQRHVLRHMHPAE
jgi:SulP family sulfate permease